MWQRQQDSGPPCSQTCLLLGALLGLEVGNNFGELNGLQDRSKNMLREFQDGFFFYGSLSRLLYFVSMQGLAVLPLLLLVHGQEASVCMLPHKWAITSHKWEPYIPARTLQLAYHHKVAATRRVATLEVDRCRVPSRVEAYMNLVVESAVAVVRCAEADQPHLPDEF